MIVNDVKHLMAFFLDLGRNSFYFLLFFPSPELKDEDRCDAQRQRMNASNEMIIYHFVVMEIPADIFQVSLERYATLCLDTNQ